MQEVLWNKLQDVLVQNVIVSLWDIIQLCLYIALTLDYNPFHHHFIISPYPLFPFCPPSLLQSSLSVTPDQTQLADCNADESWCTSLCANIGV